MARGPSAPEAALPRAERKNVRGSSPSGCRGQEEPREHSLFAHPPVPRPLRLQSCASHARCACAETADPSLPTSVAQFRPAAPVVVDRPRWEGEWCGNESARLARQLAETSAKVGRVKVTSGRSTETRAKGARAGDQTNHPLQSQQTGTQPQGTTSAYAKLSKNRRRTAT